MKKFLSLSTLLLMVLTISAQTKIAPKMKKGMKKVYVTECTIKALSEDPVKVSFETKYEVTDATSDGYVLDLLICDVKSDAKSNNLESRMYSLATEVLKDIHTTYATDKDGKVTKLLNMEEVKKQASKALEKLIAKLGGSDSIPEGTSVESIKSDWNEEAMLESVQLSTSPLVLNGKTISNGSEEAFTDKKGMKMRRTYQVNEDGSIKATAGIALTADEIKDAFQNMFGGLKFDEGDEFIEGMGSFIEGLMKTKEETTYTFLQDGWVKTIDSVTSFSILGQEMTLSTKVKEK